MFLDQQNPEMDWEDGRIGIQVPEFPVSISDEDLSARQSQIDPQRDDGSYGYNLYVEVITFVTERQQYAVDLD